MLSVLLFTGCGNSSFESITATEAKVKLEDENAVLVDVRTPFEYEEGHIEGAININSETLEITVEEKLPDKEVPIIVYCRSGNRSKEAADKLVDLGYKQVYDLGAMSNWS